MVHAGKKEIYAYFKIIQFGLSFNDYGLLTLGGKTRTLP